MTSSMPRHDFTTPEGIHLAADIAGPAGAPTVILMHGGGQTRHSWSKFMLPLAEAGYRVINYDARGHGESDWSPDGTYTYGSWAADLTAITQTVAAPCALVGASLGGIAALQAISGGYRAGALVLVDIVLRPNVDGIQRIRNFMLQNTNGFADLDEAAAAVAAYNLERPRPDSFEGLMRNLRPGPEGRLFWHWDPKILPINRADDADLREQFLSQLTLDQTLPTLLIRGMRSDIVTDANVAEFRQLLPTLEVTDVPGAGHMVAGDDNAVFSRSALSFLGRVFPV